MKKKQMSWLLIISLMLVLSNMAASAQTTGCRTKIGGKYVFVHSGVKANGNAFSAIAYFEVFPNSSGTTNGGTFNVHARINERSVGAYNVDLLNRPFGWSNGCIVWWDRPGFIGHVSDDGSTISFVTLDSEQMAGVAFRVN